MFGEKNDFRVTQWGGIHKFEKVGLNLLRAESQRLAKENRILKQAVRIMGQE